MTSTLAIAIAVPLLIAAATTDISLRMVPNTVCAALAFDGVMIGLVGHDLPISLLAAFCVFVPAVVCWRHGLMGGGDTKLLAAVSLLVPGQAVPSLILAIALAGGGLGLIYWLMMRLLRPAGLPAPRHTLLRILRVERHRIRRGFSLPYAVAISGGTLFMLGQGASI